jgi:hypothetical protein
VGAGRLHRDPGAVPGPLTGSSLPASRMGGPARRARRLGCDAAAPWRPRSPRHRRAARPRRWPAAPGPASPRRHRPAAPRSARTGWLVVRRVADRRAGRIGGRAGRLGLVLRHAAGPTLGDEPVTSSTTWSDSTSAPPTKRIRTNSSERSVNQRRTGPWRPAPAPGGDEQQAAPQLVQRRAERQRLGVPVGGREVDVVGGRALAHRPLRQQAAGLRGVAPVDALHEQPLVAQLSTRPRRSSTCSPPTTIARSISSSSRASRVAAGRLPSTHSSSGRRRAAATGAADSARAGSPSVSSTCRLSSWTPISSATSRAVSAGSSPARRSTSPAPAAASCSSTSR